MPDLSHIHTVLGFDFGMKKTGVAIGQTITKTARPLSIIAMKDGIPDWALIEALINTWKADALIVGIPLNMDRTEQPITHAARKFARRLAHRFKLPVFEMDERLSTIEAKSRLFEQGAKAEELRTADSVAAQVILEGWLNEIT